MTDNDIRADFRTIAGRLASAFRLTARPLAVYGAENVPGEVLHLPEVNRCLAVSLYRMATDPKIPGIYIGPDSGEGCCGGGLSHTGFRPESEDVEYFVSTGRADIHNGAAEYLKKSPEITRNSFKALGKVTPPGKYLVVRPCETLPDPVPGVRSLCFFGNAEQIRNMAALVHFGREDPFSPVIVPWGPACSTVITYPGGLTENAPGDSAFMGPVDPTQNRVFPPETMAIGIPAKVIIEMAANLDDSFIIKRPGVAFPRRRA
ncbi:DUF169 domain-containing protein [Methanolacinia paynteri]|uniref:DUF169 domain-containing protein n=1 Tax=Methanolacinia paynteri TaxID=230356 RepID=UPI00064F91EC|nr:DUF169 domain-containing protein [Methanolacinia paynteri]